MMKYVPGLTALAGFLLMAAGQRATAEVMEPAPNFESLYWGRSDCDHPPKGPALHVTLTDIHGNDGNIRLALYKNDDSFLKSGARVARVDFPAKEGKMDICLPLKAPGTYALAVLHDENADGKYNVFKEGYGFPGNPKLMFGPPGHDDASFTVGNGMVDVPISMKYLYPSRPSHGPHR